MDTINWHTCFFLLFAAVACASAVAMVVTSNIVHTACGLIAALAAVAGLFFLAGAEFLGAVQIMVYVGCTMVLLMFGVMLTTRGPFASLKTGGGQWILAIAIGAALLAVLLQSALCIPDWMAPRSGQGGSAAAAPTAMPLGLGLLGVRVDQLDQPSPLLRGGMCGHLLAFEIISIHLIVVLVGAAYLARARRRMAGRLPASRPGLDAGAKPNPSPLTPDP
jgi:NADH-quinone oxidoreductase subunit J